MLADRAVGLNGQGAAQSLAENVVRIHDGPQLITPRVRRETVRKVYRSSGDNCPQLFVPSPLRESSQGELPFSDQERIGRYVVVQRAFNEFKLRHREPVFFLEFCFAE